MRCKKHGTDLSSIVGVCASCLRERLFRVILAQEQAQANSDTNPPCISRRQIDDSVAAVAAVQRPYTKPRLHHSLSDQRFYNSPQIALSTGGCIGGTSSNKQKQSLIRFSSFSNLFRSSNRDGDADSIHRVSASTSAGNPTSVTSSPAWFPNVAGGRQKKKGGYVDEAAAVVRKQQQRVVSDRGMSPVRSSDEGGEVEVSEESSEYESAESCKQTPRKTPAIRRGGGGGHRSVSEMIFCLSPLVRPSPNRLWSQKGKPPLDGGDIGAPVVPHLSNTKSFCANRSRKLADFGRPNQNR